MARRNSTGLSLVVGIDKPAGLTSHDVVSRVRRIYGERRCGHMGTLDPAATGALAVCVGPATRLNAQLKAHDKTYEFTVVFGTSTDTDDAEGEVTRIMSVPDEVRRVDYARSQVHALVGKRRQLPPVYSAIKVDGKRSYEQARQGNVIDLTPRDIEVFDARLISIEEDGGALSWRVRASVSAGTYVRSIARDLGYELNTCAHVGQLRRLRAGRLHVRDCTTLEQLEEDPFGALLDPVRLLGLRFTFLDDVQLVKVANGGKLSVRNVKLYGYDGCAAQPCTCTGGVRESRKALADGEAICMVAGNELMAIYEYDEGLGALKSRCGFARGVRRGSGV
jgi:tRNA pseudouridine55 synthase